MQPALNALRMYGTSLVAVSIGVMSSRHLSNFKMEGQEDVQVDPIWDMLWY